MKIHENCFSGKGSVWRFALVVFGLVLAAVPSFAQTAGQVVEYSAKFMCGTPVTTAGGPVATEAVAGGTYFTSINIHNPASSLFTTQTSLAFLKKAVISSPEGTTAIAPSEMINDGLQNDYSEYVDCAIIRKLLGSSAPPAPAFIEGWVIILVPPTPGTNTSTTNVLDVWGVYTNAKGAEHLVPATERFFTPGGTVAIKMENNNTKDKKGS
jgi:hypothetical protein